MKYSLVTIAYVFALLAAGMAAFGGGPGALLSLLVIGLWAWIGSGKATGVELLIIFLLICLMGVMMIPATMTSRERSRVERCQANLGSVASAVLRYRSDFGKWPRAVAATNSRSTEVSWRTPILRYLEEQTKLSQYSEEEPWDGVNNSRITSTPIEIYCCPSDPTPAVGFPAANYFAVVDDRTLWGAGGKLTDDPDQTLMLIEAAGRNVSWAEPRDFTFDEAMTLLTGGTYPQVVHVYRNRPGFFYTGDGSARPGVNVAFASGRVGYLPLPISTELASALLTANGREAIDQRRLNALTHPQLDYEKIYAFTAFVLLALLPGYWNLRKLRWRVKPRRRSALAERMLFGPDGEQKLRFIPPRESPGGAQG